MPKRQIPPPVPPSPREAPRPMTEAEQALVSACLTGGDVVAAQTAVLLERLDGELAEAFVQARVRELEATAVRLAAWGLLTKGIPDRLRALSVIGANLLKEAALRAKSPPDAEAGGARPRDDDGPQWVPGEKVKGSELFSDSEVAEQEALEKARQAGPRARAERETQAPSIY